MKQVKEVLKTDETEIKRGRWRVEQLGINLVNLESGL